MSLGLLTRRGVGGAVSLGLVSRASCGRRRVIRIGEQGMGWRRVLGIADQGVVWVAPCH